MIAPSVCIYTAGRVMISPSLCIYTEGRVMISPSVFIYTAGRVRAGQVQVSEQDRVLLRWSSAGGDVLRTGTGKAGCVWGYRLVPCSSAERGGRG